MDDKHADREAGTKAPPKVGTPNMPPQAPIPNQSAPASLPQPVPIAQLAPAPIQPPMASPVPMSPQPAPLPAMSVAASFRIQENRPPRTKSRPLTRRPVALGLIGVGLLAVIGIAAGIMLKLPTNEGTLVVEVNEPGAEVKILDEKNKVLVTRPAGQRTVTIGVDPGKHRLRVEKEGFKFFAKDFEIESGKETAVKATLTPIEKPQPVAVAKVETPPTMAPNPPFAPTPAPAAAELTPSKTASPPAIIATQPSTPAQAPMPSPSIPSPTPVAAIPISDPPAAVTPPRRGPPLAVAPFTALQAKSHQIAWGRHLRMPVDSANAFGMRLMLIPPGEFMMGSTPEQIDVALKMTKANAKFIAGQAPQHRVVISKPFLMGATEVTAGQFKQFVDATRYVTLAEKLGSGNSATTEETDPKDAKKNDLRWHAPGYPLTENSAVTQVTGYDAMAFCNWRSQQERLAPCYRQNDQNGWDLIPGANGYRLPTEAEWEFACRAGTTTHFSFGDDPALLDQYGWHDKNTSENPSHMVGLKLPNPFGLYDMHGNMWEHCQDFYDVNWYKQGESIDPKGPPPGNMIVNRGGAWYANYSYCPSAFRFGNPLKNRYYNYGFRVVRTVDTASQDTRVATSTIPAEVKPVAAPQPSPQEQPPAVPTVATATPIPVLVVPKKVAPGLILLEFPRVKSQDNLSLSRPDFADLQIPVGQIAIAPSLQSLKRAANRNALLIGWLKIDLPGEYSFDTSRTDAHTLFLDGKLICSPQEGPQKTNQRVTLAAGMVPLILFRSCFGRSDINVDWQPPGQAALSPIPPDRLLHDPADVTARQKQMAAGELQMKTALPPPARINVSKYKQGLVVQSYARLPSQPDRNKETGGVDPSEFKTPNAPPTLEVEFSPWTPPIENNHVASGYLLIERPGEYAFYSDGDWGRDAMCVNGEWVSKFGARQNIIARSTLAPGMVPIQIVCYVAGKRLDVQWMPPGQRELSPIPAHLLFYNPTERTGAVVAKQSTAPPTTTTRTNDPPSFTRPANVPRIAVPTSTDQQANMELVKEVFKDDYARLKQPDEKLTLASKLIQQAVKSLGDPTGKYVMLREALRLAIDAGDPHVVEQSASALTSTFDLDEFDTLADSWDDLLNKTRPAAVNKAVAEQALSKIDRAVEAEKFAKAARFGKIALEAARKSKDNTLVKQVTDREKSLASEKQQWETLTKAAASLAENPDDPAANLLMGRHFCFVAEDWEQGLPMLAKSSDATLKDLAAKSLAATEAPALVELGDAWWSASEKAKGTTKTELLAGASHFYRLILPALTGLQKTKVEKRLADIPSAPIGTKKRP